jgi:hypothetical protein
MDSFFHYFIQVVFIITFVLVFLFAFRVLKPFRLHRKRKYSTLSLKLSYLMYLAMFFVFLTILLFYRMNDRFPAENRDELVLKFHIVLITMLASMPTIGILVRRFFKKRRDHFNLIFTAINLVCIFLLVFLLLHNKLGVL